VLECILLDGGRGSDSLAVAGPSYAGGLGDWERSGMMRAAPCCVHGEGMLERMGIGRECRSTESEANACPPRVVNSQRVYWPASPTSKDNSLKIRYHNAFVSREMMFAGVNIGRETEGRRGMTGREWKTMQKGASERRSTTQCQNQGPSHLEITSGWISHVTTKGDRGGKTNGRD